MIFYHQKGIALLTVIIIVLVLTILSSVMLSILANQTRYIEHNIARTKAKYATEATMVRKLDALRRDAAIELSHPVSGRYDDVGQFWAVNITRAAGSGISGTDQLDFSVDYSPNF